MNSKQNTIQGGGGGGLPPSIKEQTQQQPHFARHMLSDGEFDLVKRTLARRQSSFLNEEGQHVAITSTTALVSIFLTAFTLFALYTGLQNNVTVFTAQQATLKNQIQLCILLPLLLTYFTVIALEDYVRTFFSFNLSTKGDLSHSLLHNSEIVESETNTNSTTGFVGDSTED